MTTSRVSFLSDNDKGDNEIKAVAVHGFLAIFLTIKEHDAKLPLVESLMNVRLVIASNEVLTSK